MIKHSLLLSLLLVTAAVQAQDKAAAQPNWPRQNRLQNRFAVRVTALTATARFRPIRNSPASMRNISTSN